MKPWEVIILFIWNGLILVGCSYIVFGLGHSGWWFLFALLVMMTNKDTK